MGVLRPRFRLKTLLVVLAVAAISCAVIWQFWPQWRAYQARMRFERAAAQFRPGMSVSDIWVIAGPADGTSFSRDAKGRIVALSPYLLEGGWYCVYMELDSEAGVTIGPKMPSTSVKTYRLAVPPKVYLPQTQAAKDRVNPPKSMSTTRRTLTGEDARRAAYVKDFYQHIAGWTKEDLGIRYEKLTE
jgi:hypothetical protein